MEGVSESYVESNSDNRSPYNADGLPEIFKDATPDPGGTYSPPPAHDDDDVATWQPATSSPPEYIDPFPTAPIPSHKTTPEPPPQSVDPSTVTDQLIPSAVDDPGPVHLPLDSAPILAGDNYQTLLDAPDPVAEMVQSPQRGTSPPGGAKDGDMEHFAKELRGLKKQIGDALLMNTQWRQEQSKLEYCRNYLSQSMEAMVKAVRGRRFVDTRSASVQKRDTLTRRRLGLESLEEPEVEQLIMSDQASAAYPSGPSNTEGKAPKSADEIDRRDVTDEAIAKQYEHFLNDYSSVQAQARIVTKLSDDIGNAMYRLGGRLDELRRRVELPEFGGQLGQRTLYDTGSLLDAPSFHRPGAETPPLVREYFEKVGDIGIFQERLMELEDTHHEGLIQREFVKDRLDEPEVSDEEFLRNYEHRRFNIERDLENANTQAEELRQQCINEGLDVDEHRERRDSLYSSSHAPSSQADVEEPHYANQQIRQVRAPEPMHSLGSTRIGAWLQELSPQTGSTHATIEPFADAQSFVDEPPHDAPLAEQQEAVSAGEPPSTGESSSRSGQPDSNETPPSGSDSSNQAIRGGQWPPHASNNDAWTHEHDYADDTPPPLELHDGIATEPIASNYLIGTSVTEPFATTARRTPSKRGSRL